MKSYRFIVPSQADASMLEKEGYTVTEDEIVRAFSFEAVNVPLSMDFTKRFPVATHITEAEADALLAQNANYIKRQNGEFYDVYRPLSDVHFDLYKVEGEERTLLASDLVTDIYGKLDFTGITWEEDGVYELEETQAQDDSWLLPTRPSRIYVKDYVLLKDFDGIMDVSVDNYKKSGLIIVSKYERTTKERLVGAEFTLYEGSKSDVLNEDGTLRERCSCPFCFRDRPQWLCPLHRFVLR